MEYITRIAWTILYIILTVIIFTSVMSFANISADMYTPFLYFIISLFIFSTFLSFEHISVWKTNILI